MGTCTHGVISRDVAVNLGMSERAIDRRLSAGRWTRQLPGIYLPAGVEPTWRGDLFAACLWGGDAVASHRSAGTLWEFARFDEGPIEIISSRRLRSALATVHQCQLPASSITKIDGIPVTTAHRTAVDIASVLGRNELEEVLDDALARRLISIPRLEMELRSAGATKSGGKHLREFIRSRSNGERQAESLFETRLFRVLDEAGLPRPVRQFDVIEDGSWLARPDFCYPENKLIIEADSYRWHSSKVAWDRDVTRYNLLAAHGWLVIRVTWRQLHRRPLEVVESVEAALGRRRLF
ncbi:MAG: DUF559 domain-containing protein [Actinomycetota bacterium]